MLHQAAKSNRIVIVFSLIGFGLLVALMSLTLSNHHFFADKLYFYTELENAKGLKSQPAIYFKGIEVGRVDSYNLDNESYKIHVTLWVLKSFSNKLVENTVLISELHPLFDEVTMLELLLPNHSRIEAKILKPGSLIPHIDSEQGKLIVQKGYVKKTEDDLDAVLNNINSLLTNLQKEDNPDAGSLFRALDRVAKISEQLMQVSTSLQESGLVEQAEQTLTQSQQWLEEMPSLINNLNHSLIKVNQFMYKAEQTLSNYQQPAQIISQVTDSQLPVVLTSLNGNLELIRNMLGDVHSERAQFMLTIHQSQQVLAELEKTLQALNNNPLLKGGIIQQQPNLEVETHE